MIWDYKFYAIVNYIAIEMASFWFKTKPLFEFHLYIIGVSKPTTAGLVFVVWHRYFLMILYARTQSALKAFPSITYRGKAASIQYQVVSIQNLS
jgi:hypothetical protein